MPWFLWMLSNAQLLLEKPLKLRDVTFPAAMKKIIFIKGCICHLCYQIGDANHSSGFARRSFTDVIQIRLFRLSGMIWANISGTLSPYEVFPTASAL